MKILGLDPGNDCGWALWDGAMYLSGTWHLQPKGSLACGDHPLIYLKGHIRKVYEAAGKLDLIIFETPIGYVQSIGRTITAVSAGSLKCGVIISEAEEHGTHWRSLKPSEVKSFAKQHDRMREWFEKKGSASKDDMFNAAKAYFNRIPNDYDEADALWICAYGVETYQAEEPEPVTDLISSLQKSFRHHPSFKGTLRVNPINPDDHFVDIVSDDLTNAKSLPDYGDLHPSSDELEAADLTTALKLSIAERKPPKLIIGEE